MTVIAPAASKRRWPSSARALRDEAERQEQHQRPDGDVDEEDPLPAEVLRQDPAEEHARRGARAPERAPDPQRLVALGALAKGRRHDREGGRRDDRRAEALHGARADQDVGAVGEPAGKRGEREDDEPDDEDQPPPEQVGHPAAEQEEAAEGDRVGGDHPLHGLLGDVEVDLDRRNRDVHDRDVENGHEERGADDREDQPAAVGCGTHLPPWGRCGPRTKRGEGPFRSPPAVAPARSARVTPTRFRHNVVTHLRAARGYGVLGGKHAGVPRGENGSRARPGNRSGCATRRSM